MFQNAPYDISEPIKRKHTSSRLLTDSSLGSLCVGSQLFQSLAYTEHQLIIPHAWYFFTFSYTFSHDLLYKDCVNSDSVDFTYVTSGHSSMQSLLWFYIHNYSFCFMNQLWGKPRALAYSRRTCTLAYNRKLKTSIFFVFSWRIFRSLSREIQACVKSGTNMRCLKHAQFYSIMHHLAFYFKLQLRPREKREIQIQ